MKKGHLENISDQQHIFEQKFNQDVLFPNTLTDISILQAFSEHYFAHYLLGCFFYAKRDYTEAVEHWHRSIDLNPEFASAYRSMSIYSFNKLRDPKLALDYMQHALKLSPQDARVLFELDYLRKMAAHRITSYNVCYTKLLRIEAYVEKVSRQSNFEYGKTRMFGCIGWGICATCSGLLFNINLV